MKKIRPLSPLAFVAMLAISAGCTTPRTPAPIVDRGSVGRSGADSGRQSAQQSSTRNIDQRGYHTVRKGDTLLQIATAAGQNFRDLVVWNNLANPDDIKVDQVLRVLPPEPGTGTPQASSVSIGSGVEVRPLGTVPSTIPSTVAPGTPAPASVPGKNGPPGEKRPYSEAAVAELQKPDVSGSVATAPARATDGRNGDKPGVTIVPAPLEDDDIAWMWPTDGKVAAGFEDGKKGLDIIGKNGQQVLAASGGKVMYAGSGIRGYGNLVIVKHTNNLLSAYAHNKSILVKEGQTVTKGQKIAEMGNSDSDVVKLHFEIRQQGKPVDPAKFLPAR
ncbi:MAG: peptidoglycan DD-metalloendopeptidase family protein [Pseudomonadota bacterium]